MHAANEALVTVALHGLSNRAFACVAAATTALQQAAPDLFATKASLAQLASLGEGGGEELADAVLEDLQRNAAMVAELAGRLSLQPACARDPREVAAELAEKDKVSRVAALEAQVALNTLELAGVERLDTLRADLSEELGASYGAGERAQLANCVQELDASSRGSVAEKFACALASARDAFVSTALQRPLCGACARALPISAQAAHATGDQQPHRWAVDERGKGPSVVGFSTFGGFWRVGETECVRGSSVYDGRM